MTRITADWLTSPASQRVCGLLTDAGHQAWFVGGCVRNALIGAAVTDLDIATDAVPDRVIALADAAGIRAVPTGIAHGTVTLVVDDTPYEVTTFRLDIETDGRRAIVAFADNIHDDARRRDFTMNALYADLDGVVMDPLGQISDLKARRIRFIDDPDTRIREDYLRILRFFRFHAWYGDAEGGIDADGLAACAANLDGLETISAERIGQEIRKLLSAPDPGPALASMARCGALLRVLPGAVADTLPVLVHVEQAAGLSPGVLRRLAVIGGLHVAKRMRLSKAEANGLTLLTEGESAAALAYHHGVAVGMDALAVAAASAGRLMTRDEIDQVHFAARQTFPLRAADLMPDLHGPALGQALREAEHSWIESGFRLSKEAMRAAATRS